jgi:L-fuconolactonase
MMRIDAHQHFWVYDQREYAWIDDSMASLRRDFLANDLKPELERNGFQGSVVVQRRRDRYDVLRRKRLSELQHSL